MIRLARIFQNNMTFQRQKPIRIWGYTDYAQQITITLNDIQLVKNVAVDGEFTIILPAQEAIEDAKLTVNGSKDVVELSHIDIGEVWIAGGQSNMEFLLRYDAEGAAEIHAADDDHLRFYDVGEYSFSEEELKSHKDNTCWHRWVYFKPEWAEYFSAVGVYFAKKLRDTLDVPVAVVGCNWGGTTASSWTEESYLAADPDLKRYMNEYEAAVAELDMDQYIRQHEKALALLESKEMEKANRNLLKGGVTFWDYVKALPLLIKIFTSSMPMGPRNQNSPGCLYRMMLKQIAGFSCRGVIWYQGESDENKADIYDKLFSAMIQCWRDAWQEELPFLFVQLAPFGNWMGLSGKNYPILRQKQEFVSKHVPGVYMISIMDAGMKKDIHPKNKRPVGERLALLACGKIYGKDILCEPPECVSADIKNGVLRLRFDHAGNGLEIWDGKLNALELTVDGKRVKKYRTVISGNVLYIKSAKIQKTANVGIAFAWTGYCKVNLYNSAGLPAKPFRFNREDNI